MNIRRACVLMAVAVLQPLAGWAAEPSDIDEDALASELIATMKIDEQAMQLVENRLLAWCRDEKCDADLRQCVLKFDREEITAFMVSDARSELTPDELRQAIAYFRTETGLRHLDILRAERGLGGDATLFNQTPEDRARMLAFLDTRTGYLIFTRHVLTNESDRAMEGRAFWAIWRCKPR